MAWLVSLEAADAEQGRLCRRHADSMVVPQGWWLEDRRAEAQLFAPSGTSRTRRRRGTRRNGESGAVPIDARPARSATRSPPSTSARPDRPADDDPLPITDSDTVAGGAAATGPRSPDPRHPSGGLGDHAPAVRTTGDAPVVPAASSAPGRDDAPVDPPAWVPAFVAGDDLGGVLNATSPLLARAFGQVKGSGTRVRPPT
jgi:hypothetical protein